MLKYFYFSFVFTIVSLILGVIYGYNVFGHDTSLMLNAILVIIVLAVLEVGLSFDNAIVNAKVLMQLDKVWIQRFLTYGIIISVFGARLILPILIISISSMTNPIEIVQLALFDHEGYSHKLEETHYIISGFGGMFLLLVGFHFFFDHDKETNWFWFEKYLNKYSVAHAFPSIFAFLIAMIVAFNIDPTNRFEFIIACIFGFLTYELLHIINGTLGEEDDIATGAAMSGLSGFIYLNVLDTSFSLDGVVGAIAITNDIIIIMLGLGIGAIFVRSMTILLVEKGILSSLVYVEHGAFWSIIILGTIMMLKTIIEIPEIMTALLTVSLIIIAIIHSFIYNKRQGNENSIE